MAKKDKGSSSIPQASLDTVMASANEKYGEGTVFTGTMMKRDPHRIPTGIFAIDFATGGGLPIHNTTCLWGPESGAKSAIATKAVASAAMICWKCFKVIAECECSKKPLIMRSFWADIEGTMDRDWMAFLGAGPETYLAALADYGEQYIDVAETALRADDCGIVVIDSLAALVPEAEFEAPSEDQFMGTQARMIGRAVRKLKQRLIREMKREHPCTVVFTNQMRIKIGTMFGDPETMSGGHAMKHEFSLLLRCTKKSLDKKGSDAKYVNADRSKEIASRHSFSIKKEKVLTLSGVGEFVIVKENSADNDLRKGMIDDYNTVCNYAKEYEVIVKEGAGYKMFDGKTVSSLDAVKKFWKKYDVEYLKAKMEIITRAKKRIKGEDNAA